MHVELPQAIVAACRASGVRRLLHVSALGASPDAPSRVPALEGHRRAGAARRRRPRRHRVPSIGGVRPGGHVPQPLRPARAPAAGDRRAVPRRDDSSRSTSATSRARCTSRSRSPKRAARPTSCAGRACYTMKELVEFVCAVTGRRRLVIGLSAAPLVPAGVDARAPAGQADDARQLRSMQVPNTCDAPFPFHLQPAGARGRGAGVPGALRARASATRSFAGARAASRRWRSTRCSAARCASSTSAWKASRATWPPTAPRSRRSTGRRRACRSMKKSSRRTARRCAASWPPSRCSSTCGARAS